jgi:hypothetical protein
MIETWSAMQRNQRRLRRKFAIGDFKARSLNVEIDISPIQLGAHKVLQ